MNVQTQYCVTDLATQFSHALEILDSLEVLAIAAKSVAALAPLPLTLVVWWTLVPGVDANPGVDSPPVMVPEANLRLSFLLLPIKTHIYFVMNSVNFKGFVGGLWRVTPLLDQIRGRSTSAVRKRGHFPYKNFLRSSKLGITCHTTCRLIHWVKQNATKNLIPVFGSVFTWTFSRIWTGIINEKRCHGL